MSEGRESITERAARRATRKALQEEIRRAYIEGAERSASLAGARVGSAAKDSVIRALQARLREQGLELEGARRELETTREPAGLACKACGVRLVFSARARGNGLCGPCDRGTKVEEERDAVREINEGLLLHAKELEKKLLDALERLHLPERVDTGPVADRVILALNRLSECFSGCNEQLAGAYEERDEAKKEAAELREHLKDYALRLGDATKAGLVLRNERDEARAQALRSTEDVAKLKRQHAHACRGLADLIDVCKRPTSMGITSEELVSAVEALNFAGAAL